jgi:hypothetical protein
LSKHDTTDFDVARDELFSQIHRCGVMTASEDQRNEWLDDTITYFGERYSTLSEEQVTELKAIGARFCQPAIPHGKGHTALTSADDTSSDEPEMAGTT